jgi:hypothetical protein
VKKDPRLAPYAVFEALNTAELVYMCWDAADVKRSITTMIDEYDCDPRNILVVRTDTAIPFKFQKIEAVEISL